MPPQVPTVGVDTSAGCWPAVDAGELSWEDGQAMRERVLRDTLARLLQERSTSPAVAFPAVGAYGASMVASPPPPPPLALSSFGDGGQAARFAGGVLAAAPAFAQMPCVVVHQPLLPPPRQPPVEGLCCSAGPTHLAALAMF